MDVAEAEQLGRARGGLGQADPPLRLEARSQEIWEPRHLLGNLCCPEAQVMPYQTLWSPPPRPSSMGPGDLGASAPAGEHVLSSSSGNAKPHSVILRTNILYTRRAFSGSQRFCVEPYPAIYLNAGPDRIQS
jgi:hypothetical protein